MRIESVTAHAFGPLHDQTLTFAPGMTVVCGDNESAKSTWHAAVFAAVCGRRRRAGRASRDEQRFADLHRPWDGAADWSAAFSPSMTGGASSCGTTWTAGSTAGRPISTSGGTCRRR